MINFGMVPPGATLYIPFESFASSTGAPITISNFAVGDIKVYKDGGTTERASTSGFTLLDTDGIDFDGITGIQGFSIDLSDNTTADFWAAGSRYFVVVSTITVDSQTMSFIAATFRIGYDAAFLNTTIATLSSQTSFTLTTGPAEDDALNGMWAQIHDAASAVQKAWVLIDDYTGSTKTVTLAAGATFTVAAKDNISVMFPAPLQPTTTGRKLDVSTGGEAGVDWANVGSPTTTLNLSGTTVKTATDVETDTQDIQSRLPAALVSGRIDASVGAMAANTLTASALATDAVDEIWEYATSNIGTAGGIGKLITDNLDTTISSRASSVSLGTAQADLDDIQTRLPAALIGGRMDAITSAMSTAALADFFDTNSGTTYASAVAGSVVKEIADNASGGGGGLTAAEVWDYLTSAISTSGSIGKLLKDDIDATISSRASASSLTTAQADLDDIQTRLPAALVSGRMDSSVGAMAANTLTASALADDAIDEFWEYATGNIGSGIGALIVSTMDATISSRASAASLTTAQADLDDIQTRLPAALVSGRMDASVGAVATDAITGTALASTAVDKIWAKTMAELSSVPGVTASALEALEWMFLLCRNKITQTSTTQTLRNDADSATIGTSTHSDDGSTHIRGEFS